MADNTILVIGATGKVGGQVVRQLAERGAEVRAMVRDLDAARVPGGVEVVPGDLFDLSGVDAALSGVDSVFLVWPLFQLDGAAELVEVIKRNARRVVYLSSDGAGELDSVAFHTGIERLVEESGLEWTFLRATGFAGNTLGLAEQIRAGDVVRGVYGNATRSLIHEADIAAVGVRALTEDGHVGAKYLISGPEAISQIEQVRLIGEAIGRELRFEERSPAEERELLLGIGWPESFVDGALAVWKGFTTEPEIVTSTVERVTGTPARSFAQWARDHARDFR